MKSIVKGLLVLVTILLFNAPKSANAQCGTVMVNATTLYYPDTVANLPAAVNGTSYSGVLQFFVPASLSGLPITSVTVNSISGLPASFASAYSPVSGTVLANNSGCIIFTSTLVNEVVGTYPIVINITAASPLGSFPQALTGYKIQVNNPANPNNSYATINAAICNGNSYNFANTNLNAAGTYTDTLINYLGADSIITLNLTVNSASFTSINDTICQGTSLIFAGDTLTAAGIYKDTLTNSLGCDSTITLNLVVNACTNGITVAENTTWVKVSPVPFQNEINVHIEQGIKKGEINILNTLGQTLKTQKFENAHVQKIDLSVLEEGIYYLQLKSNETTQTIKIVKSN
jgi:hypothetical protein